MVRFLSDLISNRAFMAAAAAFFISQVTKIIIKIIVHRSFDPLLIFSSGGMPSAHAAFVVAATISVMITEGAGSPLFALGFVITMVVIHDSVGVRQAAGFHSRTLNKIVNKLDESDPGLLDEQDKNHKEKLGHTLDEVVTGVILGIVCGMVAGII